MCRVIQDLAGRIAWFRRMAEQNYRSIESSAVHIFVLHPFWLPENIILLYRTYIAETVCNIKEDSTVAIQCKKRKMGGPTS